MRRGFNNASDILFVNGEIEQKNDDSDYSQLDQNPDQKNVGPISENTLTLERENSNFNKSVLMPSARNGTKIANGRPGNFGFSKYYQNTKEIITQAKQVLEGENNYDKGDLDRYLLTTREIRPEKKNIRKLLPAIRDQYEQNKKIKNRLSKADESFYQQYSVFNSKIGQHPSKDRLQDRESGSLEPTTSDRFNKIADAAAELSKMETARTQKHLGLHKKMTSQKTLISGQKLSKHESQGIHLDYALKNEETEGQKFKYNIKEKPTSIPRLPTSKVGAA